jgi:3-oxoacyl-[acyl-carrier protein] reductase
MSSLDGQVAFITGAGSGLGASFARRLAVDGAHVIVNDRDEAAAERTAAEICGEVAVFDVADAKSFDDAVDRFAHQHGRLDILINNAGIAPTQDDDRTAVAIDNQMKRMVGAVDQLVPTNDTVDLSDEAFDRMIKVHLYGTFYGTRAAVRHMTPARNGTIVNVASVLAVRPMPGVLHYAAAKAGIIALTKSVGQEVAAFGIRVNVVCPGWVDTPLLSPFSPELKAGIVMQVPAGRLARAEELAELVRFLAGPESSYCNGDVFTASGGFV